MQDNFNLFKVLIKQNYYKVSYNFVTIFKFLNYILYTFFYKIKRVGYIIIPCCIPATLTCVYLKKKRRFQDSVILQRPFNFIFKKMKARHLFTLINSGQ